MSAKPLPPGDTICICNHWHDEHPTEGACFSPGCRCKGFVFDAEASSPEAIMSRGGDPTLWPEHVKEYAASPTVVGASLRQIGEESFDGLELVGAIMARNARESRWITDQLLEGEQRAHEETKRKLDAANRRIDLMHARIAWLFGEGNGEPYQGEA